MDWNATNKKVWPGSYAAGPQIPTWFSDGLRDAGGLNPRGEANYIVVWGMNVWDFCNDNPRAPKYLNPNNSGIGWACFMLERWVPSEFYDRKEWEALRRTMQPDGKFIDHLGEFKNRGAYILVQPLMSADFEPLELTQQLLEVLQWNIKEEPLVGEALKKQNAIQRKVKQAKEAAIIDKQLAERQEWYRTNSEKINTRASRHTVSGLVIPDSANLKNVSKILMPGLPGATGKEIHVS